MNVLAKEKHFEEQGSWTFKRMERTLSHAKSKGYSGYSKFDAMNSPVLESFFGGFALTRLIWIQAVNRSPLDLRKLTGVKKSRNPKGIANFIKAYSVAYEASADEEFKELATREVEALHSWQVENCSQKICKGCSEMTGLGFGYNFPWENPSFYAPRYFPNAIVTVFTGEAFLRASQTFQSEKYLQSAVQAAEFMLKELPVLIDEADKKCLGYTPARIKLRVVNINSVIAGFLSKLYQVTGNERYLDEAKKMVNWVLSLRTDYDAWHYTDPPTNYVKNHDNYHTGGIVDGLFDFMRVSGDKKCEEIYWKGLDFYAKELFEEDGAPKWRNHKSYPYDVHGSAQGILSFAKAAEVRPEYLKLAQKIAHWADENLSSPDGGFFYQKHKYFTMKFDLMRWNNSWMAWALAELALAEKKLASN